MYIYLYTRVLYVRATEVRRRGSSSAVAGRTTEHYYYVILKIRNISCQQIRWHAKFDLTHAMSPLSSYKRTRLAERVYVYDARVRDNVIINLMRAVRVYRVFVVFTAAKSF